MSDAIAFALATRTARAGEVLAALAAGTLQVYGGLRPTTPDDAVTDQTLLVEFPLPTPAGAVNLLGNFELDHASIDDALAATDGTATWARLLDAADGTVADCDCGAIGSGAGLELDNVSLLAGGRVAVDSLVIIEG